MNRAFKKGVSWNWTKDRLSIPCPSLLRLILILETVTLIVEVNEGSTGAFRPCSWPSYRVCRIIMWNRSILSIKCWVILCILQPNTTWSKNVWQHALATAIRRLNFWRAVFLHLRLRKLRFRHLPHLCNPYIDIINCDGKTNFLLTAHCFC